jgi:multiple antibiotic resistance protein
MPALDFPFLLSVITALFAIINPIGLTPIFVGLTEQANDSERRAVARQSVVLAFLIVAAFVVAGKVIFKMFGLTVPSFNIAGGVLVFFVGLEMLRSRKSTVQNQQNVNFDESIAISPLGIPIIAGPGTIVTAMNFAQHADLLHTGLILVALAFMLLLIYLCFLAGRKLIDLIGPNKIDVLTKLMGLIVAVIGTNMVISGIKLAFFDAPQS